MIAPGSRLAPGKLAGVCVPAAALFLLTQGCLVPQSVDELKTRPHSIPRVDLTKLKDYMLQPVLTLDPQEQGDLTSNPPCHCQLEVSIPVIIADDPTVDIEVFVFVDYDLNVTASQPPVDRFRLDGSFTSTETTRPLPPIVFDSAKLRGVGLHVVELVMGERQGFASTDVFPPQRAMLPDYESSTFKFVVQVLPPNPARQSCSDPPQLPPQVKSCP
jgi:hypothetical protein